MGVRPRDDILTVGKFSSSHTLALLSPHSRLPAGPTGPGGSRRTRTRFAPQMPRHTSSRKRVPLWAIVGHPSPNRKKTGLLSQPRFLVSVRQAGFLLQDDLLRLADGTGLQPEKIYPGGQLRAIEVNRVAAGLDVSVRQGGYEGAGDVIDFQAHAVPLV